MGQILQAFLLFILFLSPIGSAERRNFEDSEVYKKTKQRLEYSSSSSNSDEEKSFLTKKNHQRHNRSSSNEDETISFSETSGSEGGIDNHAIVRFNNNQLKQKNARDFTLTEQRFFQALNQEVFTTEDPLSHKIFRWCGRGIGLMADQAMTSMVLYVLLGLFNVPVDSELDWTIIGLTMAYLLLPSMENMAMAGHNIAEQINDIIDRRQPLRLQEENEVSPPPCLLPFSNFRAPFPGSFVLFNTATHLHAGAMALILTMAFKKIEVDDNYDWYFWTFAVPYGLSTYVKNVNFFQQGQQQKIKWFHHRHESRGQRTTRKLLEDHIKKIDQQLLFELDQDELNYLYNLLINKDETGSNKIKNLKDLTACAQFTTENLDIERASRLERGINNEPVSFRGRIATQLANMVFFGSLLSEFFFYQYGLELACMNFGLTSNPGQNLASNLGAAVLTFCSAWFEGESIKQYYYTVFQQRFGSSNSASHSKIRKAIGVQAFAAGCLIGLSETYPAWQAKLEKYKEIQYPLLAYIALRHHARNAFWVHQGYDHSFSNYHLRDCWRESCDCCPSCKISGSKEVMINSISHFNHKLLRVIDQLGDDEIALMYKAFFGHQPDHD